MDDLYTKKLKKLINYCSTLSLNDLNFIFVRNDYQTILITLAEIKILAKYQMMFLIIINIVNCDNGIDFMCDNANVFFAATC